jgi:transcriptional repressor NrdR
MRCPYCSSSKLRVVDKRATSDMISIRRRRECLSCKARFTSYETIEKTPIYVLKKDLSRVAFDKLKVLAGVSRACEKRPVNMDVQKKIADEVESILRQKHTREVTSKQIGELVLKQLLKYDKVAYIRFASVYKQFESVEEFQSELMRIEKNAKK